MTTRSARLHRHPEEVARLALRVVRHRPEMQEAHHRAGLKWFETRGLDRPTGAGACACGNGCSCRSPSRFGNRHFGCRVLPAAVLPAAIANADVFDHRRLLLLLGNHPPNTRDIADPSSDNGSG